MSNIYDMDTTTISGPELKATLQGLGIPPSWFADRVGVTMRTVVRWFDVDAVPDRAAAELATLNRRTLTEMHHVLSRSQDNGVVSTYRTDKDISDGLPASWHRALTFRVLDHLRSNDLPVSVRYF